MYKTFITNSFEQNYWEIHKFSVEKELPHPKGSLPHQVFRPLNLFTPSQIISGELVHCHEHSLHKILPTQLLSSRFLTKILYGFPAPPTLLYVPLNTPYLIKGKSVPLQAWSGPEGSRKLRFPDFMTTAQEGGKVVSHTHWPHLPPGNSPGTHFC